MRRPVVSLVLAAGLLALSVPVLALETGTSGPSTLPDRFDVQAGVRLLNEEFLGPDYGSGRDRGRRRRRLAPVQEAFGRLEADAC